MREDGSVLPCELTHVGDEDGQDLWEIAGAEFRPGLDRVEMDVLPARTSIRFAGPLPGGPS